jgi:hypothetical protein
MKRLRTLRAGTRSGSLLLAIALPSLPGILPFYICASPKHFTQGRTVRSNAEKIRPEFSLRVWGHERTRALRQGAQLLGEHSEDHAAVGRVSGAARDRALGPAAFVMEDSAAAQSLSRLSGVMPGAGQTRSLSRLSAARGKAPPPPPSRTNWTRLVPPSVLTGHVSRGSARREGRALAPRAATLPT